MEGKSLLILTSFCIGLCTHGNTEKFYMKATPQNCGSAVFLYLSSIRFSPQFYSIWIIHKNCRYFLQKILLILIIGIFYTLNLIERPD